VDVEAVADAEFDLVFEDGGAEAEAAVDGGLGGGERCDGQAAFLGRGERGSHEVAGDALATVRGAHGDVADLVAVDHGAADVEGAVPFHEGGDGDVGAQRVVARLQIPHAAHDGAVFGFDGELVFEELFGGVGVVEPLLHGGEPCAVPRVLRKLRARDFVCSVLVLHPLEASKWSVWPEAFAEGNVALRFDFFEPCPPATGQTRGR